jgi:hypothetical protein
VPSVPIPNFGKARRMAKQVYGEEAMAIFVMPRKTYGSYHDFWRLAELSGFELLFQDEVDLRDPRQTYVFAAPERIPDCTGARARTIFWSLEYAGDYTAVENAATVSEVWSSDPAHARRTGAKYVLLGSYRGLNPDLRSADESQFDLTMLAYMVDRRRALKERLDRYSWTPDTPGHGGAERHNTLKHTRLMLHVHQHDAPALAPLRLAVAAAYQMPVISEAVEDEGPYRRAIVWSQYGDLVSRVKLYLDGKIDDDAQYSDALYRLLCVDQPFGKCVTEALADSSASAVHGIAA